MGKREILPEGRYDCHLHIHSGKVEAEKFWKNLQKAGLAGAVVLSQNPAPANEEAQRVLLTPEAAIDNVIEWTSASETLYPFYWINPILDDAMQVVKRAIEKGICGFKVIPSFFAPGDERAMKVYRFIAEAGKPILFHSGILWDGRFSSQYTRPGNYEALLGIPHLRFVMAHISWPWVDECIAVYGKFLNAYGVLGAEKMPEMFIDITPGTPEIYRREALTKIFTVGYNVKDHILFGDDCCVQDYCEGHFEWVHKWQGIDDGIYEELQLKKDDVDSIYRKALQRFLFGGYVRDFRIPKPGQD